MHVEYIVVDGSSTDDSLAICKAHGDQIDVLICEPDRGPASAINKGLRRARGQIVAWLNADDFYYPGTLQRIQMAFNQQPRKALAFGRCQIVDEKGIEIRRGITKFKEFFFPFSSRFTIQSINYISQPSMFFRRPALAGAGLLREDMKAAWDYEFILRLWRQGGGFGVRGSPLSAFRWHSSSISAQHFRQQFKEEFDAAAADAGRFAPQTLLHWGVRWGIVWSYSLMTARRDSIQG